MRKPSRVLERLRLVTDSLDRDQPAFIAYATQSPPAEKATATRDPWLGMAAPH